VARSFRPFSPASVADSHLCGVRSNQQSGPWWLFKYRAVRALEGRFASALNAPPGANVGQSHNAAAYEPFACSGRNARRRSTPSVLPRIGTRMHPSEQRPNPSLHLTFASRLRRLSPAGELKR
jgi:hypothetical protein